MLYIKEWDYLYKIDGKEYCSGIDASKIIDVILLSISDLTSVDRILIEKERIFDILMNFKDENFICEKFICEKWGEKLTFRYNDIAYNGICDDKVHYDGSMLLHIDIYPASGAVWSASVLFNLGGWVMSRFGDFFSLKDFIYKNEDEIKQDIKKN